MAESIWEAGRLREVFEPVGRRANGELRYRRAKFDVLEWAKTATSDAELYVVPSGFNRIEPGQFNVPLDDKNAGSEFGFYSIGAHVIEPHEADGKSDTWKALHGFGAI